MKITRIFLDLDDVLNCFTPYVLNQLGCPIDATTYGSHLGTGWDFIPKLNSLHPKRKIIDSFSWNEVCREIWASIPRSNEFTDLLRLSIAAVGKENIFILTRPIDYPDSLAGKMEWIHVFCPSWLHEQYFMGKYKHVCANPNALLIDDNEENVKRFQQAGGHALLMPRPWNHLHAIKDTKAYLEKWFRHIFMEAT